MKTITKLWAVNPSNDKKRRLLATFTTDGDEVEAEIDDPIMKQEVERGFYTKDGLVTLKDDSKKFMEILTGDFAASSYINVEITEA